MAGEFSFVVEVQLATDVWTDITADVISRVNIRYGIAGNGPMDLVTGTGECILSLKNDASNSGGVIGYYSPQNSNVRSGWTFGLPLRVAYQRDADSAAAITSITRSSNTATVTAAGTHGLSTGDHVKISGASQSDYNGRFKITKTGSTTFTYTVLNTPVTPATGTKTWVQVYIKHRGKIRSISPGTGQYRKKHARVISYDIARDLAETDAREVAIQVSETEEALYTNLLASLPAASRPVDQDIDTGIDTFPYAFDDLGSGTKAIAVLQTIAENGYSRVTVDGDGTLRTQSRHTRLLNASAATFTDNDTINMDVPSTVDVMFNVVRLTISPKTIDASATTVLWSAVGDAPSIVAGGTITLWVSYRDPDDNKVLIGGTEAVTSLVENTDYDANSAANGSGSDLSSSISIVATAYATTAKLVITNSHASSTAYMVDGSGNTKLQIRGKGIYNLGPQTFEASSVQPYGTRPLNRELDYQSSELVAIDYANFLESRYNNIDGQVDTYEYLASSTDASLKTALDLEPGDKVTISETVTGVATVVSIINSVELTHRGNSLLCKWGLSREDSSAMWLLGTSKLDITTVLGF
jgi:hypothetical protein